MSGGDNMLAVCFGDSECGALKSCLDKKMLHILIQLVKEADDDIMHNVLRKVN